MTKTESVPKIIALFNDQNRQKEYENIYKSGKEATMQQLATRILLLQVFRDRYPTENSMNFNWTRKNQLFKLITQSAKCNIDEHYLIQLSMNFLNFGKVNVCDAQNREQPVNRHNIIGKFISHPTTNELRSLVDMINKEDEQEALNQTIADSISETPKQFQDGTYLLKVNMGANREHLLKEFDIFLNSNKTSSHYLSQDGKSELSIGKLEETCYLELFDMMIFEAFYIDYRKRNLEDIDASEHCEEIQAFMQDITEFYGRKLLFSKTKNSGVQLSIPKIIHKTIDSGPNKHLSESYKRTVKKNINDWVDDKALFAKKMSELKVN
jgi:hypothetical protein